MCEVPLPWKSAKLLQEWIGCFFDMPTAVVRNVPTRHVQQ